MIELLTIYLYEPEGDADMGVDVSFNQDLLDEIGEDKIMSLTKKVIAGMAGIEDVPINGDAVIVDVSK